MTARKSGAKILHIFTVPISLAFIRGQVQHIKQRGFTIDIVTSPGANLHSFGEAEDVAVHPVSMRRKISPLQDIIAVLQLMRELKEIDPMIVHAHTPKGGLLGMIAARMYGVPVRIYHMRGLPYMTAKGRKRTLLQLSEKLSCLLADRVFCVSHSIREVAVSDGICPARKITVLGGGSGNGVDSDGQFNPERFGDDACAAERAKLGVPGDAPVVLFVGRIVRDKGVEDLARAWEDLRSLFPDAYLILVGPPELQDPISHDTKISLIEDKRVIMTGEVEDSAIYYALADVVVLPTYREGFPNVPLEAAAFGRPVVATSVPGCIDAVQHGITGTLVPPRDSEALCDALRQYLQSPALRAQHGRAGRLRVIRDFRQEVIWAGIYGEYCQLLAQKNLPLPS